MLPLVSICLAARNETAMLIVTVLSAIESCKVAGVPCEIVIAENSDAKIKPAVMECLAGVIKDGERCDAGFPACPIRVIDVADTSLALAIQTAHDSARGEYLIYSDAHCIFSHDTVRELLRFHETHKAIGKLGFVHAPIQWAHRSSDSRKTHMNVERCKLGEWAGAKPVTVPSHVTWKGMPYMITREAWNQMGGLGVCADKKLGWGVLSYLGMKAWFMGFENWAIPTGTVTHLGEWPESVKPHVNYRTYAHSGAHTGLAKALAIYIFGGEDALRAEFDACGLSRYGDIERTVHQCITLGAEERREMQRKQVCTWDYFFATKPWASRGHLISDDYRRLNAELHQNTAVKYGYKGHEQAELVMSIAREFHCTSILDYGAGKQTLSAALKKSFIPDPSPFILSDYDPAIEAISAPPQPADLVVCTDVLEHVEPERLDAVLDHLRDLTRKALIVRICTVPCTSKTLPDGSDPHRIVRGFGWWTTKLTTGFTDARVLEHCDRYFTLLLKPVE